MGDGELLILRRVEAAEGTHNGSTDAQVPCRATKEERIRCPVRSQQLLGNEVEIGEAQNCQGAPLFSRPSRPGRRSSDQLAGGCALLGGRSACVMPGEVR